MSARAIQRVARSRNVCRGKNCCGSGGSVKLSSLKIGMSRKARRRSGDKFESLRD